MPAVGMDGDAFHDGGELQILAAIVAKEMVELKGVVGIEIVDHGHGVPAHAIFLKQTDALHDLCPRGTVGGCAAVFVVEVLRTVDGDAYEPVVLFQKPAPLIGEQSAVGLDGIGDVAATGILLL